MSCCCRKRTDRLVNAISQCPTSCTLYSAGKYLNFYSLLFQRILLSVAACLCIRKGPRSPAEEAYENGVYSECVGSSQAATESHSPRDLAVKIDSMSSAQTWTLIAAILDRIFFLVYLLVIVVLSTVFILPK